MVVAQLVEWSLPKPEVRDLNPVLGKIYIEHSFTKTVADNVKGIIGILLPEPFGANSQISKP